jgi:hypothetical protein
LTCGFSYTPNEKYDWCELRGVLVLCELWFKDMEEQTVMLALRDTGTSWGY